MNIRTKKRSLAMSSIAVVVAMLLLATGCQQTPAPSGSGAAADPSSSAPAWEPTDPITVVAHGGAGSGGDVLIRMAVQILGQKGYVTQRMTVENRTGGESAVAQNYIDSRKGDPYTIGLYSDTWLSTAIRNPGQLRSTVREFTPLIQLAEVPLVMVVPVDSPYSTLRELVDDAKANPHKIKQVGGTLASVDNLSRLLIEQETGAIWDFVPFESGGERIAALLGGRGDLYIGSVDEISEHVRSGKIKPLCIFAQNPLASFPGVPTLNEAGFTSKPLSQTRGVLLPADVPPEAADYYIAAFRKLADEPEWKDFLASQSNDGTQIYGDDLKTKIETDFANLEAVLKASGQVG